MDGGQHEDLERDRDHLLGLGVGGPASRGAGTSFVPRTIGTTLCGVKPTSPPPLPLPSKRESSDCARSAVAEPTRSIEETKICVKLFFMGLSVLFQSLDMV